MSVVCLVLTVCQIVVCQTLLRSAMLYCFFRYRNLKYLFNKTSSFPLCLCSDQPFGQAVAAHDSKGKICKEINLFCVLLPAFRPEQTFFIFFRG